LKAGKKENQDMAPSESESNVFESFAGERKAPLDIKKLAEQYAHPHATDWTIPEAYLCLLVSAAYADGELAPEEHEELIALAHRARTLRSLSRNDLAAANDTVNDRLRNRPDALQEACDALPNEIRLSVFAQCVEIVVADGELMKSEADFLETLLPMLDIDTDVARRIMEVMLIKNRF
jgi:uncharacterized tellurite resistance protein B-like protein